MHDVHNHPLAGNYCRVLRRYDRDPKLAVNLRFVSYDTNIRSFITDIGGKQAVTLFFPNGREAAAQRATKLGWKDETEAWIAQERDPQDLQLERLAKLNSKLDGMTWQELKTYTVSMGATASGKRADVESRLRVTHAEQIYGVGSVPAEVLSGLRAE